ncbi:MAG: universal stress protein, partial [Bacteroidia bacterium]
MKNILVPTDFSEEAKNALKVAVDMAKTFDGQVVLLNVVDAPGGNQFSSQGSAAGGNSMDDIFTFKLLEKMKNDARTSNIPVIIQSAAAERKQVDEGIAAGAFCYLIKPFE